MERIQGLARGLKREGLIVTWLGVVVAAWLFIGLLAVSQHTIVDWSLVRFWELLMLGLFAYGHLARKLAQLAQAIAAPEERAN